MFQTDNSNNCLIRQQKSFFTLGFELLTELQNLQNKNACRPASQR
jgi:hypothetical protein